MGAWLDRLGGSLIDAGLPTFLVLGIASLAMVASRQPARRYFLAYAALIGSLAVWPLVVLAPIPRFELRHPLKQLAPPPPTHCNVGLPPSRSAPTGVEATLTGLADFRLRGRAGRWASRSLAIFYIAGVSAGFGGLILGWWGTEWLRRRALEPRPRTLALYQDLPFAGPGPRPNLLISTIARRPVLIGLWRPAVLIPAELERVEHADSLKLSLLHELAHSARRDPLACLVGNLAYATWFLLPPVWWVRSQMRLDQEFLADRHAAAAFGPSYLYARKLVDYADPAAAREAAGAPTAGGARGGGSTLWPRIVMLLRCPFTLESDAPRWWRFLLPPVVACGTLIASTLTLRSAERHGTPAAPARAHGSFQLARLMVEPEESPGSREPYRPYFLPVALPDEFDLSFEVWAPPSELIKLGVAGVRFEQPPGRDVPGNGFEGWHQIKLQRTRAGTRAWLDGEETPCRPTSAEPMRRLAIFVDTSHAALFRNLTMTW